MKGLVPTGPAVVREALTVLAGALLAALIIGSYPPAKDWIKRQWE